jgi:O-antigen ligase
MAASAIGALRGRSRAAERWVPGGALLVVVGAIGAATALALRSVELPAAEALAAGVALLGVLALAIARYEAAVTLGFLVFAIVQVEPSPSDVVFAVVIVVAFATGRFNLRATPLGPAVAVAAFVALNVISSMEALDAHRAASFASTTIYLIVFALWVAGWVTDRSRARRLVRIYVLVAALSALAGGLALFVPLPGHGLLTAYQGTRARALFKDPNVFGPFLVPAALLLSQELLWPRLLRLRRGMKIATLAIVSVGILLSYSRAAWLNFAVGAVVMGAVFALRRNGGRQAVVFVGVLALALATIAVAVSVTGQESFLQQRARLQTYDTQRFAAQSAGFELGTRHPIGVGPGQFELYEPISAHSTYVRALAEEGPLGFLVLVAIMAGTLLLAVRNAVRGQDTHGIASTVLLAAWCGILANSVFIDTLHWRHLWLLAGLIWCGAANQTSSYAGARSPM